MKPIDQQKAIAEICGWRNIVAGINHDPDSDEFQFLSGYAPWRNIPDWVGNKTVDSFLDRVPDYVNDLNAMHEAEKLFANDSDRRVVYMLHLKEVVLTPHVARQNGLDNACPFRVAHATAAQRAEAFLRTLNLWDDSK